MSSTYDTWNARTGYEAAPMHPDRASERSRALKIDASFIPPTTFVVPPISLQHIVDNSTWSQGYQLGYRPGDQVVSLTQPLPPAQNASMHTSNHTYERAFVGMNLPPILFRLEPSRDVFAGIGVPTLHDASTGRPVVTNRGQTLRYFSFLPRYIAWNIPGSVLEFWFRLDYRLEMNDIIMRIESGPQWSSNHLTLARNALQMRRGRFRDRLGLTSWAVARSFPERSEVDAVRSCSPEQFCFNTKMPIDMANRRLLKPIFQDIQCTQPIGYVDSGLPLGHFLGNLDTTVPSRRMLATLGLRHRLQKLARIRGLNADAEAWKLLNKADEPRWWNSKTAGHDSQTEPTFDELDGDGAGKSHTQWISQEFGTSMAYGVAQRHQTRQGT